MMSKRFDPRLFHNIAINLKNNKDIDQEGRYRTSVGRAYYAAFLITRNRLKLKGKSFDKNKQHKDVREYLKVLNQEYLASQLKTLFDYRVKADYKLNERFNHDLCKKCIIISQEIINSIENF